MTFVLLQYRNIGTFVRFNLHVCLCINCEKKKYLGELDLIHPALKSAVRDVLRPNEHPVLAIGLLQYLGYKWP